MAVSAKPLRFGPETDDNLRKVRPLPRSKKSVGGYVTTLRNECKELISAF